MNNIEFSKYIASSYEFVLKRFHGLTYQDLSIEAERFFFDKIYNEQPKLNFLIYNLSKDLSNQQLSEFLNAFYTKRLINNQFSLMLKLKHLTHNDLKSYKNSSSGFIYPWDLT